MELVCLQYKDRAICINMMLHKPIFNIDQDFKRNVALKNATFPWKTQHFLENRNKEKTKDT